MLDDAIALAEKLKPEIMEIRGLKHWLSNGNKDGNCALIGIYESHEAAEAATNTVRASTVVCKNLLLLEAGL